MIINNGPIRDVLEIINDTIPNGHNCKECGYRKADKCILLNEYLAVNAESYKKNNLCLVFKLNYSKDIPVKKTYKERCAKTML